MDVSSFGRIKKEIEIMSQFLDRVTVTGADDSVAIADITKLVDIAEKYPFVEFGILFSKSSEGQVRFPKADWVTEFVSKVKPNTKICAHICGKWVRDICEGNWDVLVQRPQLAAFQRFQLNFHASEHMMANQTQFLRGFERSGVKQQIIFQMDGVNDDLLANAVKWGVNAVGLFDRSGGAGILPRSWPVPRYQAFWGYAGGLSPVNVAEQIGNIEKVSCGNGPIWIDAETHLYTNDVFDLEKVSAFLEAAKPWVIQK